MSKTTRTIYNLRSKLGTLCTLGAAATLAVVLAAGRPAAAADHPNVQPGNWQMTMTMEMPGIPMQQPLVTTQGIKPDQVKDNEAFVKALHADKKSQCQPSDIKLDSSKLSYKFTCDSGSHGTAEIEFSGTSYEATITTTAVGRDNRPTNFSQHIKA